MHIFWIESYSLTVHFITTLCVHQIIKKYLFSLNEEKICYIQNDFCSSLYIHPSIFSFFFFIDTIFFNFFHHLLCRGWWVIPWLVITNLLPRMNFIDYFIFSICYQVYSLYYFIPIFFICLILIYKSILYKYNCYNIVRW